MRPFSNSFLNLILYCMKRMYTQKLLLLFSAAHHIRSLFQKSLCTGIVIVRVWSLISKTYTFSGSEYKYNIKIHAV